MWVSLAGVVAVGGWLFFRALSSANRMMAQRLSPVPTKAREKIPA